MEPFNRLGIAALVGYALTVPAANWSIGHVGTVQFPGGPHVIPVWSGIYAPSGVLWIGAALALRNLVQDRLGKEWGLAGVFAGALLSWWLASPALAAASAGAFAASELSDMAIWSAVRRRGVLPAQIASNVASDVVDSICFLWLAFGSLSLLAGQIIGKELMTACTVLLLIALRFGRYGEALDG